MGWMVGGGGTARRNRGIIITKHNNFKLATNEPRNNAQVTRSTTVNYYGFLFIYIRTKYNVTFSPGGDLRAVACAIITGALMYIRIGSKSKCHERIELNTRSTS